MTEIVSKVIEAAEAGGGRRVHRVSLSIGALTHLAEDQLRTAFGALTRGTIAEGARLEVTRVPARVRCLQCGYGGTPPEAHLGGAPPVPLTLCPECGEIAEIAAGRECLVRDIEIEVSRAGTE